MRDDEKEHVKTMSACQKDFIAKREAEAKKKIAAEASKLLRAINARFRNAERTRDGTEAARLRGEAEERLKHLSRVNVEAWPWAPASSCRCMNIRM